MDFIKARDAVEIIPEKEVQTNADDDDDIGSDDPVAFMNFFDDGEVAAIESPNVLADKMVKNELYSYIHGQYQQLAPMNTNIIKWWEDNKNQFPVLYLMHCDYVAIQGNNFNL